MLQKKRQQSNKAQDQNRSMLYDDALPTALKAVEKKPKTTIRIDKTHNSEPVSPYIIHLGKEENPILPGDKMPQLQALEEQLKAQQELYAEVEEEIQFGVTK